MVRVSFFVRVWLQLVCEPACLLEMAILLDSDFLEFAMIVKFAMMLKFVVMNASASSPHHDRPDRGETGLACLCVARARGEGHPLVCRCVAWARGADLPWVCRCVCGALGLIKH